MTPAMLGCALMASLTVLLAHRAASAAPQPTPSDAAAALLDRAQIEDMLTDYYGHLGGGADRNLDSYYLQDGVLDVNGVVAHGRKAIDDLYKSLAAHSPGLQGKFHMLLNNPKIVVQSDTATVDVIWTGVLSETPQAAPRILEQGREHDELVKRSGRWYFKYRVITSDGGLPATFQKTYRDR
jgi:hypothetical protein